MFSEFLPLDYPRDVPDPYLGQAGFDRVIDIIEHGCPRILDHLLRGRHMNIGFGRGAGRVEFEGMRVPMGESRQRFLEALEVIRLALRNEQFSYQGEFFQIDNVSVRPRPRSKDLEERMYCAWGSPTTIEIAARAQLGPLFVPQKSWEEIGREVVEFNGYREEMGLPEWKPIVCCWAYCAESESEAQDIGGLHMTNYGQTATWHYELDDPTHFEKVGGYEHYASSIRASGDVQLASRTSFTDTQIIGTADECLERMRYVKEVANVSEFIGVFMYGGMPVDEAEKSMRRFAEKVLPVVQRDF